ncbi:MAG TPA: hypothetical protein VLS90_11020 [Thermodesulfobacteriota bacterium]|nr:hypothetical protein [Thermodesulfobacteriota bacterium]
MWAVISIVFLLSMAACAGVPVRDEVKLDAKAPVGKIEGNQFTGIRYPFNVTAPPGWKIAMTYPEFLLSQGFEKGGVEDSQAYVYNPETKSSVQIELSPAGRRVRFDQKTIEYLTAQGFGDIPETYGKTPGFQMTKVEPYKLKTVPYAAKQSAVYNLKGQKQDHGIVYAFAEPFQIFIIYLVTEKGGAADREAVKAILDSFEMTNTGKK